MKKIFTTYPSYSGKDHAGFCGPPSPSEGACFQTGFPRPQRADARHRIWVDSGSQVTKLRGQLPFYGRVDEMSDNGKGMGKALFEVT